MKIVITERQLNELIKKYLVEQNTQLLSKIQSTNKTGNLTNTTYNSSNVQNPNVLSQTQVQNIKKFTDTESERSKVGLNLKTIDDTNKFRKFVNDNYKQIADYLKLDPPPSQYYITDNVVSAWNYKVPSKGNNTLGALYLQFLYEKGESPKYSWQLQTQKYENVPVYTPPTASVQYTDYYSPGAYVPNTEGYGVDSPGLVHTLLDVTSFAVAFVPLVGPLLSVGVKAVDTAIYYHEKDYESAGLSLIMTLIPASGLLNKIPAVGKLTGNLQKQFISKVSSVASGGAKPIFTALEKEALEQMSTHSNDIVNLVKTTALNNASKATNSTLKEKLVKLGNMGVEELKNYAKDTIKDKGIEYTYSNVYNSSYK
jgi:hypothetical protein